MNSEKKVETILMDNPKFLSESSFQKSHFSENFSGIFNRFRKQNEEKLNFFQRIIALYSFSTLIQEIVGLLNYYLTAVVNFLFH